MARYENCPECQGTGYITTEMQVPCSACNGTGGMEVPGSPVWETCGSCGGSGMMEMGYDEFGSPIMEPCGACGGSGGMEVPGPSEWQTCRSCSGTGTTLDTHSEECTTCNGTGQILVSAPESNLSDYLETVAEAIRTKKGTSAQINAQDFSEEIASIETGNDTSDATATANGILAGKTAYVDGDLITGNIQTWNGAYESITWPPPAPAPVSFATDSWETISAACKDGSYKTVYQVGDTKDIELSTGETITVAIMGFDHDDLSDGSGKAPITLGMTELLATRYPMNSTNTNAGGWDDCLMRTSTMATFLTQLPSDLQSVIKQVNKKAMAGGKSESITTSADKLWLFAEVEIDGTTSTGYSDDGEQYEYWKTVKDGTVDDDRKKYLSNGSGSANPWWLRSPILNFSTGFRVFSAIGSVVGYTANYASGVSFGFCIG